jgi:hypothetical protein
VVAFLSNCFRDRAQEEKSIKSAANNNKNIHLIVICRSCKSTGKKNVKYHYVDKIVSSAICFFGGNNKNQLVEKIKPCILLWFGTVNAKFESSFGGPVQEELSERIDDPKFRGNGLGTLLLSIIQQLQRSFNGNDVITCQANKKASLGFYLHNHFKIIEANADHYISYKNYFGVTNWIESDDLVLVKSRIGVNKLHYWIYENMTETEAFPEVIIPELLKVYFPQLVEKNDPTLYYGTSSVGIGQIIECINSSYTLDAIDSKGVKWTAYLDNDNEEATEDSLPFAASHDTLVKLLDAENFSPYNVSVNGSILPSGDDNTSSLFYIFSKLLSNNWSQEPDIRCILGFLYGIFAVLSDMHPFYDASKIAIEENSCNLQSNNIVLDLFRRLQMVVADKEHLYRNILKVPNSKKKEATVIHIP